MPNTAQRISLYSVLLLPFFLVSVVVADETDQKTHAKSKEEDQSKSDKDSKKEDKKADEDDEQSFAVTHQEVEIDGTTIKYTATAGRMLLKADDGDEKAHMFFIAYTRDDEEDAAQRPVTFCFNGGPGSSSVWLHLGMLGPQRVKLRDDAKPQPPPFTLVENHYSLLDITDLVFVDPVSTGFSRPADGENKKQFHGYDEDLKSVGQFIHDYTTRYERWASPKFLIGESYGGLRSAGLAGTLQDRYHMYLNGIVLVSAVVDFQTLSAAPANDLPYILFLPSYTATAWYHKVLDDDLQKLSLDKVVRKAEKFARGPYARALWRGTDLPAERRAEVAKEMSKLTGLSADYIELANLRVHMSRFAKELLRDRRQIVGRFDSRYLGIDRDAAGERYSYDPSYAAMGGVFTAAMNHYLRSELDFKDERVYEILTGNVRPWNYGRFSNRYVSASETLRSAMTTNPFLKVFAACGHYDLATPQFAMQYTRDHLGLAPELQPNFTMGFYAGGHMMYVYEPALIKLRKDLVEFYEAATKGDDQQG